MEKQNRHIAVFRLIALLILIGVRGETKAQLSQNNYQLEARAHYGYLYFQNDEYHSALGRYSMHAPAFELSLHRNTYGQHRWEVLHNYPAIGFTFYYSGFNWSEVSKELGHAFALYPFINFPIIPGQDTQLTFKLGVGLAYLTNKFDPKENYHNYAIGSHLNAAVNLSFEYRQRVVDRLQWVTSFGLTHFSNGATRSPNMGINIFSVATGFSWYLQPAKTLFDRRLRPKNYLFEFDGKRHFITDVQYTFGIKDLSQQYGTHRYYFVHDLAAHILLQITERDRIGLGVEVVQDNSDKTLHPEWNSLQRLKVGGLLAYEMMLDRVSFMFNVGIRNNKPFGEKAFLFYQKVGLRYYFWDDLFATLSFTTYDIKADFISLGIGYHIQYKYYMPKHEKKPHRSPVYPR